MNDDSITNTSLASYYANPPEPVVPVFNRAARRREKALIRRSEKRPLQ